MSTQREKSLPIQIKGDPTSTNTRTPKTKPKPQEEFERIGNPTDENETEATKKETISQEPQEPKVRQLDNWLASYLYFTRHEESPEMFHLWTGLTLLATIINRNVWMPRNYKKCYPNLYVLFTGPSGVGKSSAAEIGVNLLEEIKKCPPIFRDSITTPALLSRMAEAKIEEVRDGQTVTKTPILIYASELGNLLTPRTGIRELALLLTELFTKEGTHHDSTMGRGNTEVVNPNVTALLCCFSKWLEEELPSISMRSGFLGRQCVVFETAKRFSNPKMESLSNTDNDLRQQLKNDLEAIAELYGEMQFSQEGWNFWEPWYQGQPLELADLDVEVEGFHARKAQFVLRVAMLISLSNKNGNLIVTKGDLKVAMELIDNCELATKKLGAPEKAHSQGEVVLKKLIKHAKLHDNAPMPLWKLMQKVSREMNKDTLMKVMDQLVTSGLVGWNSNTKTVRLIEVKSKGKEKEKEENK